MSLEKLAEVSRFYGANPDYVIAGGGNTSFKDKDFLYVKASGTSLDRVKPGDFVKMNRAALSAIWEKTYPADHAAREAAVLEDIMAARCPGEENKRPSVETLLHDMLPYSYVVHTHPALVNGLTCSQDGEKAAKTLFPQALWIPLINPGYILSRAVKEALRAMIPGNNYPAIMVIILQNHGVFVAANTTEEIDKTYENIMGVLGKKIKKHPDFGNETAEYGNSETVKKEIINAAKKFDANVQWFIRFERNNMIAAYTAGETVFNPVSSVYSPDHMVYSGIPLYLSNIAGLEAAFKTYTADAGKAPKIIAVQSLGVFSLANSEKAVGNALELFRDTMRIAVYSGCFGGPRFMTAEMINFINNWEVEHYRSKVSEK